MMSMYKNSSELGDVVSAFVYCPQDQTIMLTVDSLEHWMPSIKVPAGQYWDRAISREVQEIFGTNPLDKILRLNKLWIPRHSQAFIQHAIFQVTVDVPVKNKSKNTMGKYRNKLRWVSEVDLSKLVTNNSLKSPELIELFYLAKNATNQTYPYPEEYRSVVDNMIETGEEILVFGKGNIYFQLVEASGIDKLAQEALLKEFTFQVYPAIYMSLRIFTKLISDLGWIKDNAPFLFRAADINLRGGLSFRELIYFLATVDPNTSHGGAAAEIRCRYMFRYYDRDRDNVLKIDEFKNLIADLRKSKKLSIDPPNVAKEATDTYKAMGVSESTPINVMEFLKAICDLKIRGTSTIFRSSIGAIKYLKDLSEKSPPIMASPSSNLSGGGEYKRVSDFLNGKYIGIQGGKIFIIQH